MIGIVIMKGNLGKGIGLIRRGTSIANLSETFKKEKLIVELAGKANKNTIAGIGILNAIVSQKFSTDDILKYVQEQAQDSFKTMCACIGDELTNKILQIKL